MDDQQIHVPESFLDLFRRRRGDRLQEPAHRVLARYEICEDLAQALCLQGRSLCLDLGVMPADVAPRMTQGLSGPEGGLAPEEADWVTTRLIELMENP